MEKITSKQLITILLLLFLSGCYNTKIITGEQPSSEKYENKWAASWIGGLVPPEVVNVEKQCTNGVAIVETKHSFLNILVSGLTSGIFTPMHITVTCAENSTAAVELNTTQDKISVSKLANDQEIVQAFQKAVDKAVDTGKPVFVYF